MTMQNLKVKQLKRRLKKQWDYFNADNIKDGYSEMQILDWVADSVILFEEIGVSEVILEGFMETFKIVETEKINNSMAGVAPIVIKYRKLGPFMCEEYLGAKGRYKPFDYGKINYIKIAFRSANAILDRGIEEERIVPKFLINELEANGNYNNIISSLDLIQIKYENRDSVDLTKNVVTLLENIIDLEPSLKNSGKMIGEKLGILMNDEQLLYKFGVDKDMVRALSNSRVIRNIHTHKKIEIKYDIPFLVTCSFVYLVIIFLEITLSTGELIKNDKLIGAFSPSKSISKPIK